MRRILHTGPVAAALLGATLDPVTEEFLSLASSVAAQPVARVRYQREPYESATGDPVRITFDTALGYQVTRDCSLEAGGDYWTSVPLKGTILEIKFTGRYPGWVSEMVRCFELQRRSVAKYVLSMEDAVDNGRYWPSRIPVTNLKAQRCKALEG